jgi:hypothetical protein
VQFRALLTLLADEDVQSSEGPPVSRDMQRVAEGFLNLSTKSLAESSKAAAQPAPVVGDRAAAPPIEKVDDETAIARVVQAYAKAYSDRECGGGRARVSGRESQTAPRDVRRVEVADRRRQRPQDRARSLVDGAPPSR